MIAADAVSTIPPQNLLSLLTGISLLLIMAHLLGQAASYAGLPKVTGELLAGILVGPSLLGALAPALTDWLFFERPEQFHLLDAIGQFGALLLVGLTGTDLDLRALREHRPAILAVCAGGLVLPMAAGIGAGFLVPGELLGHDADRLAFALFLGTATSITSVPVAAKILLEMGLARTRIGQVNLSAAVIDDTAAWLLLSVVAALVSGAGGNPTRSLVALAAMLLLAATLGRMAVRRLLALAVRANGEGPAVGLTVVVVLSVAAAAQAIGLEPVFGAFIAGLMVSSAGVLEEHHLKPLRVATLAVFAPIFLATVGLRVDLRTLGQPLVLGTGAAILALAVATKLVGAYTGARVGRLGHWEAVSVAAGMNARGVVGIVAAGAGQRLGLLSDGMYAIIVGVAVLTTLAAPPLLSWSVRRASPRDAGEAAGHVDERERLLLPHMNVEDRADEQ